MCPHFFLRGINVLTWFSIFGNLFNFFTYVRYLKSHVTFENNSVYFRFYLLLANKLVVEFKQILFYFFNLVDIHNSWVKKKEKKKGIQRYSLKPHMKGTKEGSVKN